MTWANSLSLSWQVKGTAIKARKYLYNLRNLHAMRKSSVWQPESRVWWRRPLIERSSWQRESWWGLACTITVRSRATGDSSESECKETKHVMYTDICFRRYKVNVWRPPTFAVQRTVIQIYSWAIVVKTYCLNAKTEKCI